MDDNLGLKWALFSFDGRMGKKFYFFTAILPFLAIIVATILLFQKIGANNTSVQSANSIQSVISIVDFAWFPIMLWNYCALTIKRLHDMNMNGWLVIVALVPLIALPAFLMLSLLDGTQQANNYGPKKNSRSGKGV